tara:strand:+ start:3791 stop:4288 length:498 start_codon:yes stop_codon:yes gene_type:complete
MEKRLYSIFGLIVIASIIIILAFVQFFQSTGEDTDETQQIDDITQITYPTITPDEVVEAFFTWYLSDDNALPSDNYLAAESLTDTFKSYISDLLANSEQIPVDPFTCGATDIEDLTIRPAQITLDHANVTVEEALGEGDGSSFIIELVLSESAWKIDNVLCFIKS